MKNKIHKCDFLIVGAGLIGSIAALALHKNNFKVLVIDKEKKIIPDKRTLAVNANSREFLIGLGIWDKLKSKPQSIEKIIISDYINHKPLIFENNSETMGDVIFNYEMVQIVRAKLKKLNILKTDININFNNIQPNKTTVIGKNVYKFKKIIISIGKNNNLNPSHRSIKFDQGHNSFVGFFGHYKNHQNFAYEIFNPDGPLAILPSPSNYKNKSTFIYTTKKKIFPNEIKLLIKKNFKKSHGQINFEKSIYKFPIKPNLTKDNKDFIYIGDSLKSIHPVAGQGWNLGIKDIQKLIKLSKNYSIDDKIFNSIYYSNRIFESSLYLGFTSLLNFLYENEYPINYQIIKFGHFGLRSLKPLREFFIKQAMGRSNLI